MSEINNSNNAHPLVSSVTRCCSFCNSTRHNILHCNDPQSYQVEAILYQHGLQLILRGNKDYFIQYFARDFPLKHIKLFACRLHIRSSGSRRTITENIYYAMLQSPQHRAEVAIQIRHQVRRHDIREERRFQTPTQTTPPSIVTPNAPTRVGITMYRLYDDGIFGLSEEAETLLHSMDEINNALQRSMDEINNVNFRQVAIPYEPLFKPVCSVLPNDASYEENECPICYTDIKRDEYINTECNHKYCFDCMQSMYKTAVCSHKTSLSCAICRARVSRVTTYREIPGLFQM
jgi:hypothetical protein